MTKEGDFVHNTISPFSQKLGYQETTKHVQYKPLSSGTPHLRYS